MAGKLIEALFKVRQARPRRRRQGMADLVREAERNRSTFPQVSGRPVIVRPSFGGYFPASGPKPTKRQVESFGRLSMLAQGYPVKRPGRGNPWPYPTPPATYGSATKLLSNVANVLWPI